MTEHKKDFGKNETKEETEESEEEIPVEEPTEEEKEESEEETTAETDEDTEEETKENDTPETIAKKEKHSTKLLIVSVAILIIIVGLLLFLQPIINLISQPELVTIDDIHKQNLEGKETDTNYIYNGFSFVFIGDLWYTKIRPLGINKEYAIPLEYGPRELEDIPVSMDLGAYNFTEAQDGNSKNIYVTYDPTRDNVSYAYTALALSILYDSFLPVFNINIIAACTTNHTICEGRPIVSCEEAKRAVIYINDAPGTSVSIKGNCVTLQGEGEELRRATNRFLYQWYGVMK